jgi:AcrR family transcriptional regulator
MPARRIPRKKPTQGRSKETVAVILTAAARVLERDGYARANVNRIAAEAGVSVGSLYQYFPTKEAIAAAVGRRLADTMRAVLRDGIADLALLPLDDAIGAVSLQTVRAFRVSPRLREVLVDELPENVLDSADFDTGLAEMIKAFLEFHRDAIRACDLDLVIPVLMAAVEAAAKKTALRDDGDQVVAAELTRLVTGYLRRP